MLKKQRLTAMEGKHHDALPRYTRKGRTKSERPLCNLCGLEDGACICRHLPPPKP